MNMIRAFIVNGVYLLRDLVLLVAAIIKLPFKIIHKMLSMCSKKKKSQ
jgi:hypothetical protein